MKNKNILPDFLYYKEGKPPRPEWKSRLLFIFASCNSSIGMSNYMTFPSLCAKHGGLKIFAVPYLIFVVFVSIPLLTLYLGLG